MWHPSPEDLARLVDETPTAAEAEHLGACAECTAELDAMRAEHDALGALPRILPVPTSWESMRHRLEREGMLRATTIERRSWMPGIAAALALFFAGGTAGILFAGAMGDGSRELAVASEQAAAPVRPAAARVAIDSALDAAPPSQPTVVVETPVATAPAKLAANDFDAADSDQLPGLYGTPAPTDAPDWQVLAANASRARTPDEAARFVRDAEGAYLAAMTRLAELTAAQSSDPAVRLATLDGIVVTTAAALERSPADPVINGYHLAARAQRDALLRTVSSSPAQDPWY